MFRIKLPYLLFAGLVFSTVAGCGKLSSPPAITTRPEATKRFQKIIKEEIKQPAFVRDIGDTVWVYVPQEENILEIKAAPAGMALPIKKLAIRFLKVTLQDKTYNIDYAIVVEKQYGGSGQGDMTDYPESFKRKQQNIVTAVARSYLDME